MHLLESEGGFISVLVAEVVVHPKVSLSAQLVSGLAVWDALDHTTLRETRAVNKQVHIYSYNVLAILPSNYNMFNSIIVEIWVLQ